MTTDSDGYHVDMKYKRKALYHFSLLKVIPHTTNFNIEYLFDHLDYFDHFDHLHHLDHFDYIDSPENLDHLNLLKHL